MTGIVTKSGDSTVLNSTISYNSPSNTATSTQVSDWNDGVDTYTYIYNDNGNIASISSNNHTATYEYDTLDRLTRANDPIAGKTWVYNYNSGGNILKRSEYAYTANALGTPSEEVTYTYGDSQWKDLLTAYNGKPITYDEIGNPLTYDGWTYTWQHGRQLVGMEKEGSSISYAYNTDGKRISKTVGGTTYVLKDGGDGNTMFKGCRILKDGEISDVDAIIEYMQKHLNGKIGAEYANPYGKGRITIK